MASPNEVIDDPQVDANGYMPRVPDHSTARLTSAPVRFDGTASQIRTAAPDVGEHTDEVFMQVGVDGAELSRLRAVGAVG